MNDDQKQGSADVNGIYTIDVGSLAQSQIDLNSYSYSITDNSMLSNNVYSYNTSQSNYGTITINTNGSWGATSSLTGGLYSNPGLKVTGDAEFENDIKVKGRSLTEMLTKIEDRLAILTPDSKKLEHFAALKKAYDHYKALEALCELPVEEDDNAN